MEKKNIYQTTNWEQFKADRKIILALDMYQVAGKKEKLAAKRMLVFLRKFKKDESLMEKFNFDKNQLDYQMKILYKFRKESFMLNDSEYNWIDGLFLEGLGTVMDYVQDVLGLLEEDEPEFPNGFRSWMETHHEVVSAITVILCKKKPTGIVAQTQEESGSTALYDLAKKLTDEFEKLNEGLEWGVDEGAEDFMEAIEEFLNKKLK